MTSRKKPKLMAPDQFSDFRLGIDAVVRDENGRCWVVDGYGILKHREVASDVLTPEARAKFAALTPEQRRTMTLAFLHSRTLSAEGRTERLAMAAEFGPAGAEGEGAFALAVDAPAPEVAGERLYYVTVRNAGRTGFLLGPYATHEGALVEVWRGRDLACRADRWAWFYAFGTASLPADAAQPKAVFGTDSANSGLAAGSSRG